MNNISDYIFEKLKINKDSKVLPNYNIGDHCIILSFFNWKSNMFKSHDLDIQLGVDIIEITKITKEKIYYKFLTGLCHTIGNAELIIDKEIKEHSPYYSGNISHIIMETIIPNDESLDIIKQIEKHKSYKFFKKIGYCPKIFTEFEDVEIPILLMKDINKQAKITQDEINELKDKLNNEQITEKLKINKDSKLDVDDINNKIVDYIKAFLRTEYNIKCESWDERVEVGNSKKYITVTLKYHKDYYPKIIKYINNYLSISKPCSTNHQTIYVYPNYE